MGTEGRKREEYSAIWHAVVVGGHEGVPLAIGVEALGGEGAVGVGVELENITILGGLGGVFERWALGFEGKDATGGVEDAVVDPEVGHHGADPRADEAVALRVVADREDHGGVAAAGHRAVALGLDPEGADGADGLAAGGLHRRLAGLAGGLALEGPVAEELLEPEVLLGRFGDHHGASLQGGGSLQCTRLAGGGEEQGSDLGGTRRGPACRPRHAAWRRG